jgi:2-polyprenyl-6-methoxyphenol hydroxylase-like FAD-dependent oxidoreductase
MRLSVLGGGPAGLYFASLWKRRHPAAEVRLFEQNPAGATFGFGVVFSARALDFLRDDDPEVHALIVPRMEQWQDMTLVHRGEPVVIDGVGYSSIGRLELLQILQARARSLGVELIFDRPIRSLDELGPSDLIVGADGLNSIVRRAHEATFGSSVTLLDNKFAWYGTTKRFETLTLTFVENRDGAFTAHHYRYSPTMSTFIVECDKATFERVGFQTMPAAESRRYCESVFAATLDGHPLVENNSIWRNFPVLSTRRWWADNCVLVGDALHTAHFTIGSGTRLALEDVIALAKALDAHPGDLAAGLARYQEARQPVLAKLLVAAQASAAWHERFPEHLALAPLEFAMSYVTRTGRIDDARLREMAPRLMARYEGSKGV